MTKIRFLPQNGQYEHLLVYKKAQCICDITDFFCKHFLPQYGDRTVDQMRQAARSGKQNIVEGTSASATSKETEIKLINVAKASHQELLEDYKDYLSHNNLKLWKAGEDKYERTRHACKEHNDREFYNRILPRCSDEAIANIAITIIYQEDKMLYNLLETLKQEFLEQGGIREEMTRGRMYYRAQQPQDNPSVSLLSRQYDEIEHREKAVLLKEKHLKEREENLKKREDELAIREDEIRRLIRGMMISGVYDNE